MLGTVKRLLSLHFLAHIHASWQIYKYKAQTEKCCSRYDFCFYFHRNTGNGIEGGHLKAESKGKIHRKKVPSANCPFSKLI